MNISYDKGDSFTFGENGVGLVLASGKALLISGGGRTGHSVAVEDIPIETIPLLQQTDIPYEIKLAFQAVKAVLEASRDTKAFQNPTNYWQYDGEFSVELTSDADKGIVPPSAEVQGDIVRVTSGSIKQETGGIQLYSEGKPFHWGYASMKCIRNGSGGLLWVNYKHR